MAHFPPSSSVLKRTVQSGMLRDEFMEGCHGYREGNVAGRKPAWNSRSFLLFICLVKNAQCGRLINDATLFTNGILIRWHLKKGSFKSLIFEF